MVRLLVVLVALAGSLASAQPVSIFKEQGHAPRNYANLRVGAASSSPDHPELCLEVSPLELVSLEACGTGSGFLHKDTAPEISHFRANLKLMSWQTVIGYVQPRLGLGFAELQVGEDLPGFDFGGTGPNGAATSGPELGLSLRCLTPLVVGLELVTELNLSAGVFAFAPKLARPMAVLQPTFSVSLGFGF